MPPMPPPSPVHRATLIALVAVAVIIALAIGVAIGRATGEPPETVARSDEPSQRGKLKILSTPTEANVILDGRFIGIAPLENLDVEPGKHSVVIDVFGYQPFAGIVEVEPRGRAKLTVALAPLNGEEGSVGNVSGGIATRLTVPRSALMPGPAPAGAPAADKPAKPAPRAPAYVPPERPRRNCSGENSTCRDGCYRANTDCDFSCPGCSSCNTSTGWDECKRQCDTCRNGCNQNKRFCESSCETQNRNCEASQ